MRRQNDINNNKNQTKKIYIMILYSRMYNRYNNISVNADTRNRTNDDDENTTCHLRHWIKKMVRE